MGRQLLSKSSLTEPCPVLQDGSPWHQSEISQRGRVLLDTHGRRLAHISTADSGHWWDRRDGAPIHRYVAPFLLRQSFSEQSFAMLCPSGLLLCLMMLRFALLCFAMLRFALLCSTMLRLAE